MYSNEALLIIKAVQRMEDTQGLNRGQLARGRSAQMESGRDTAKAPLSERDEFQTLHGFFPEHTEKAAAS